MKDTIQSIRLSAGRFFSGTLISRFSGMMRDMAMAYIFGTQASIAYFMVSFRFALILRRFFGEGTLQSAFIPEFESLRHQNEKRAFSLFKDLTIYLSLGLILLIACVGGLLLAIEHFGHLPEATRNVLFLTSLMLPSLLFICLYGLNSSFLQCEKKYFGPSVAPTLFNVIWMGCLFYLKGMSAEEAMPWLACGIVIACFFQWLVTVPQTWNSLKNQLSFSFQNYQNTDLQRLKVPLLLGMLGVAASQVNNAIDSLFALFAEPEGPALLWYAIRIQQLPLALFGIAVAGAVLPPLTRARQNQNQIEYEKFLHDALYQTWIFMLPLTAILFVMGDGIVTLIYGRGHFSYDSIIATSKCLWAYATGLIPSSLILIFAPAFYSQNNYKIPVYASFASMLTNLLLNGLFIFGFGWGALSIALATSCSAWINVLFLSGKLVQNGTTLISKELLRRCISHLLICIMAAFVTYFMNVSLDLYVKPNSLSFFQTVSNLSVQSFIFFSMFLLGHLSFFLSKKVNYFFSFPKIRQQ